MAHGRPWTGAEEIRLRNAIEAGDMTRAEICEMLGREKDTVRRKCHKLGIRLPPTIRIFKYEDRVYEQPPSSIERSTQMLGRAIRALIARMDDRTLEQCLGTARQVPAGAERVYKTASIERMAA
jgi:hypothetical protein